MMRYLPHIIISVVLYTLFFYKSQEPELLIAKVIPEKVIPLDFKKLAEQKQQSKTNFLALSTKSEAASSSKEGLNVIEEKEALVTVAIKKTKIADLLTKPEPAHQTIYQPSVATIETKKSDILLKNSTPAQFIDEAITEKIPDKIEVTKILAKEVKVTEPNTVLLATTVLHQDNKKQLLASIKSTLASESALIKSEVYEQEFHLELPAPPAALPLIQAQESKKNSQLVATENISKDIETGKSENLLKKENTPDSAINSLLKQTQSHLSTSSQAATINNKGSSAAKPKRTFKKQPKTLKMISGQSLQQAITVSGNKPHYPEGAKADNKQGTVSATFTVNMKGKTDNPRVTLSSGHKILDDSVLNFIKKERFMPSLEGREKVTREQQFFYQFSL